MRIGTKIGNTVLIPLTVKAIDLLDIPGVVAFSTMRSATDVSDPYDGFNTCSYTGDAAEHVESCRSEVAQLLGIDAGALIMPRQTHSANVKIIYRHSVSLEDTDALVTCMRQTALCIHTADCVPVVMADVEAGVIGAAHSGWRGAEKRIVAATVDAMCSLGARPDRIVASMGPSICPKCFEVGDEVAQKFERYGAVSRINHVAHVDLYRVVAATLEDAGVNSRNISLPPTCSLCDCDNYFSARAMGVSSGRTLSVIMLR
ncbi:peptidoglycan editing factor PgeF [Muribaculaceae bacterium Isolate-104 (HZI)]|nr:peptidoglycan editing factor PgeF [Muribaculaceae bacterium Isolate-104 (HZI)]